MINLRAQAMAQTDERKQSLYFPEDMLQEMKREAVRQDRWIVQRAWQIAKNRVKQYPSINPEDD